MARRILALLLIAMAVGQMSDPVGFIDIIGDYEVGGRATGWAIGPLLVAGELTAGLGLLLPRRRPARAAASTVAIAVAVTWSALATQAFIRGLTIENCGCFGVHLGQELRWWILLEDTEFIALALWAHLSLRSRPPSGTPEGTSRGDPGEGRRRTSQKESP